MWRFVLFIKIFNNIKIVPEYRVGHAQATLEFAIDMLEIVSAYNKKMEKNIQLRIGINSGSVVSGVIGKQKFCFDLVNIINLKNTHLSSGEMQSM